MWKIFIFIIFSFNFAFAGMRFSDVDKKNILSDIKNSVDGYKGKNNNAVDFQIIKPGLQEALDTLHQFNKITNREMKDILADYENLSRNQGMSSGQVEMRFYQFIDNEIDKLNNLPVEVAIEGNYCNEDVPCEGGLICAIDPLQKFGKSCQNDSDCASGSCLLDSRSHRKTCDDVSRCYRPLNLNERCNENPICKNGLSCKVVNYNVAGKGECKNNNSTCSTNLDCCSDMCDKNRCVAHSVCGNCADIWTKPKRGQDCCDYGYLYEGQCVPLMKPVIPPQPKVIFIPKNNGALIINFMASLFIENAEAAQTAAEIAAAAAATKEANARSAITSKLGLSSGASDAQVSAALDKYELKAGDDAALQSMIKDIPSLKSKYQSGIAAEQKFEQQQAATIAAQNKLDSTLSSDDKRLQDSKTEVLAEKKVDPKVPQMSYLRKSNFKTCDIYFRDDFYIFLKNEKFTSNGCQYSADPATGNKIIPKKGTVEACSGDPSAPEDRSLLDMDIALLSFDYVLLGESVDDYWTQGSDKGASIYGRLKAAATKHHDIRSAAMANIEVINTKLKCLCLATMFSQATEDSSVPNLPDKKAFFDEQCGDYKKLNGTQACSKTEVCTLDAAGMKNGCKAPAGIAATSSAHGVKTVSCFLSMNDPNCHCTLTKAGNDLLKTDGASGIAALLALIGSTEALKDFTASLTVDYTGVFKDITDIATWTGSADNWSQTGEKTYTLFNYNVKNPSATITAMGAALGAILAGAVIAVMGGFASPSLLTAGAATAIITAGAVTGGGGLWLMASLKGAWITKQPQINDKHIRDYGCGKKETCAEYSRELIQPYNEICKIHTSANACIKNFAMYTSDDGGEERYLVDPWVPVGVDASLILKDGGANYAEKMEDGFQTAKAYMISLDPKATGGSGKSGGQYVPDSYRKTIFVDGGVLAKYAPQSNGDAAIDQTSIDAIKAKAKDYANTNKLFEDVGSTEYQNNLTKFADYVYQFHFLWPKTSRHKEISYPPVGLNAYLELMSYGSAASMATGMLGAAGSFLDLNSKYYDFYLQALGIYGDPINLGKCSISQKSCNTIDDCGTGESCIFTCDDKKTTCAANPPGCVDGTVACVGGSTSCEANQVSCTPHCQKPCSTGTTCSDNGGLCADATPECPTGVGTCSNGKKYCAGNGESCKDASGSCLPKKECNDVCIPQDKICGSLCISGLTSCIAASSSCPGTMESCDDSLAGLCKAGEKACGEKKVACVPAIETCADGSLCPVEGFCPTVKCQDGITSCIDSKSSCAGTAVACDDSLSKICTGAQKACNEKKATCTPFTGVCADGSKCPAEGLCPVTKCLKGVTTCVDSASACSGTSDPCDDFSSNLCATTQKSCVDKKKTCLAGIETCSDGSLCPAEGLCPVTKCQAGATSCIDSTSSCAGTTEPCDDSATNICTTTQKACNEKKVACTPFTGICPDGGKCPAAGLCPTMKCQLGTLTTCNEWAAGCGADQTVCTPPPAGCDGKKACTETPKDCIAGLKLECAAANDDCSDGTKVCLDKGATPSCPGKKSCENKCQTDEVFCINVIADGSLGVCTKGIACDAGKCIKGTPGCPQPNPVATCTGDQKPCGSGCIAKAAVCPTVPNTTGTIDTVPTTKPVNTLLGLSSTGNPNGSGNLVSAPVGSSSANSPAINPLGGSSILGNGLGSNVGGLNSGAMNETIKSSDGSAFAKAISNLNKLRAGQLKKLAAYKSAVAKSPNPARAEKMAEASKSFASKFESPNSGMSGGGGGAQVGGAAGGSQNNASGAGMPTSTGSSYELGRGSEGVRGSSDGGSGGGDYTRGSNRGNKVENEDKYKMAEAARAFERNKGNNQAGKKKNLWETITDAYFRSYSKLLDRKDKDVLEKK